MGVSVCASCPGFTRIITVDLNVHSLGNENTIKNDNTISHSVTAVLDSPVLCIFDSSVLPLLFDDDIILNHGRRVCPTSTVDIN